ncbi:MAG: regulatory protein RecX [Gammaproteobacteria bacterium]|nr:regulatory protein RecX [Gammaproteobacteria bacterium]
MKTETLTKALDLLARREHSTHELRRKLLDKGHTAADIDTAISALVHDKLLSDGRFTEMYVHARTARGYGPLHIAAALRERGIDKGLIAQHVHSNDPVWRERAAAARRKRFGRPLPASLAERARQTRFLAARGFTHEQIGRVLKDDDSWEVN